MRTIGHFLNGTSVEGTSGRYGDIFNPATGEVQAKVAFATRSELRKAVENARKAFSEWSAINPQRRARV
ncbi:MAG TPA: aldehyde dehydrogenase family protein, partial [Rhizomicrobium sp.]|nr:aldehyde dehydrogenase family protein [Rhizomicrobium sp.]